jgi:outer membrane protein TolC
VVAIFASFSLWASDVPLELGAAEALAVAADPAVRQIQAQADALGERAVSRAQLPDPKLKLGAAALPVNSFDLDQEPMTQLQLGFQQRFLPGDTLELRGEQMATRSNAMSEHASDQQLQTLRSLREDYLEVNYQQRVGDIIDKARVLFEELVQVTQDHYATGRTQQQDVYRAKLELSRLDDRATRNAQSEEMARARLAVWIGEVAYGPLANDWPGLTAPKPLAVLIDTLDQHPMLRAMQGQVSVAELGVEVARQQYKPGWMLDVTYGDRSGQNLNGSARSDFITAMVSVDLPMFKGKRQDRELAATLKDVDASMAARQNAHRKLQRAAEREWAALKRLDERLALFDERLLPDARANSDSSLEAYQSGVGDITSLMRAQITEYELQLNHARARVDQLITRARLLYLSGDRS